MAVVTLGVACGSDKPTAPSSEIADVYTTGSNFSPTSTTIGVGGTVRWNISLDANGEGHDVTFTTAGAPANIPVVANPMVTVVSRVFPVKGTFEYECRVHPGMNGEVIVH